MAVSGRNPAPQVAVAAVAEAAKSAVRVPVVWILLDVEVDEDEVVDEDEDVDVDEEVVVEELIEEFIVEKVFARPSTIAAAIALPIKAKRTILRKIIGYLR